MTDLPECGRGEVAGASRASLSAKQLANLLEIGECEEGCWSPADAPAALRQQLHAPFLADARSLPGAEVEQLELLMRSAAGGANVTLLEALESGDLELLEAVKTFGKQVREQVASPLCGAAGTVIYYAAIAAGCLRVRGGDKGRLTALRDDQLCEGFRWCTEQEGAEPLKKLFERALHQLT
jgi:hypothetical protein